MFERFTDAARAAVVGAQAEARSLGHSWIGTEHLLLALLADPATPVAQVLGRIGVTHDGVRDQVLRELGAAPHLDDGAALRDLGIDLDAVRQRVEERFGPGALDASHGGSARPRRRLALRRRRRPAARCGPGHLPFSSRAKKALELALRESLSLGSREIDSGHLALGILRCDGLATRAVTRLGVSTDDARVVLLDQLGRAA
jgi:ATP-dependent Clp protease ATP-binding subunit ClpA